MLCLKGRLLFSTSTCGCMPIKKPGKPLNTNKISPTEDIQLTDRRHKTYLTFRNILFSFLYSEWWTSIIYKKSKITQLYLHRWLLNVVRRRGSKMWHEKDIIQPLIALVNSLTPTITRHIEFINARKFSNILVYSLTHRLEKLRR